LSTGELGTISAGVTASVTNVGDGWYRCAISKSIVNFANVAVYTATSNGGASYVGNGTSGIFAWGAQFVEGTDAQFAAWTDRDSIEAAGWKVVRLPATSRLVNLVAIGNMHFSHAGHLTKAALQRFVNQVENRKFKPIKNSKARYVLKVTMYTSQLDELGFPMREKCRFCDEWMDKEYPLAIADGAEVVFVQSLGGKIPRFDVCNQDGQVCQQFIGFTAWSKMRGNQ